MTEAVKQEERIDLDSMIEAMSSDDFKGPEPSERLSEAITLHGGSFRQAISDIKRKYASMIASAGTADHEELKRFLDRKGIAESPEHRRRVENATRHRIEQQAAGDIKPPLALVVRDLVAEEQERRDKLSRRAAAIEAEQKAEADQLGKDMKNDPLLGAAIPAWSDEIFRNRQKLKPLEEAHLKAQKELRSLGYSKHEVDGRDTTEYQAPGKEELENLRRKAQETSEPYREAEARVRDLIAFGAAICNLQSCSVRSVDVLERAAAVVLGQTWHRAGELTEGSTGEQQFRTVVITSAPKSKSKGGLLR